MCASVDYSGLLSTRLIKGDEMKHTKLPWKIGIEPQVVSSKEGKVICRTSYKNPAKDVEGVATAEFIVRACNSHYELLEALVAVSEILGQGNQLDAVYDKGWIDELINKAIGERR